MVHSAFAISLLFGWRYVAPSAILDDTPLPLADDDGLSLCELASADGICYLRVLRRIHDDLYVAHVAASPDLLDTEPHTAYFSAEQLALARPYDCRTTGKSPQQIRAVLSACAAARLPEPTPAPRRVAPVQRPQPVPSPISSQQSAPEPALAEQPESQAPAEPDLVALQPFYVSHKQVEQQLAKQQQPLSPDALRRRLQQFVLRCVLTAAAGWREMCATIKRLLTWLRGLSTSRKPRVVSLSEVRSERGGIVGWWVVIGVPPELADLAA